MHLSFYEKILVVLTKRGCKTIHRDSRWFSDTPVAVGHHTGRWQASVVAVGRRNHGKVDPLRFQTSGGDITPAVDSPTRRSPAASSSLRLRYFSAGRRDAKVGRVAEPALMQPSWALVLCGVVWQAHSPKLTPWATPRPNTSLTPLRFLSIFRKKIIELIF